MIVNREAHELVGPGADRMIAQLRPGAFRHDRHHQLIGNDPNGSFSDEADRIRIDAPRRDSSSRYAPLRGETNAGSMKLSNV